MLSVTRLLTGTVETGDVLRYGRQAGAMPAHLLHFSADKKPIVVWNVTRRCNLSCMHCYSDSHNQAYRGELSTEEGWRLLDDLAAFGVPTVLFSGGEPLIRPDLFELAAYARDLGLRCVLSTNGTLITSEAARRIQDAGFSYVGVSFDGLGPVHDKVRGKRGAYEEALEGLRLCHDRGTRVGLRLTVHQKNLDQLSGIFDLLEVEDIPRCCVYHLAYAGRGDRIKAYDLTPQQTQAVVDYIFERARDFHRRGLEKEILTVDNHTDGVYLYLRVREEEPQQADEVYQLLRWNGGNQSGIAVACVDPRGFVHADQFSWHYPFGNVRQRPFSLIWTDKTEPQMAIFKDRKSHLKGRCRFCRACYLSDEAIGLAPGTPEAAEAARWPVPVQEMAGAE
jgi:MoaA/NifB/PqqE/SkfB family radical SAM enzyme